MTLTDKTGAPVNVTRADGEFDIAFEGKAVERKPVGLVTFVERDVHRVFLHTEVEPDFRGRGLATLLIGEGLAATRADGMRIIAVCPMVAAYVKKHHEYDDIVDLPTPSILNSLP